MLSPTPYRKPSLLWFWRRTWTSLWIFSGEGSVPPCSSKLRRASVHDWVSREEGNEGSWKAFQRKQAPKWGKSLSKDRLVGIGAGVESRKDEWRQWGSGGRRHDSGVPSPVLPASLCDWVCPCPSLNPWTLPLSFLSQSIHLLEEDDSLYCISAWNDQVG